MIEFYNDGLAPKGFCKLIYDLVPEELHTKVIFKSRGQGNRGECWSDRILIYPTVIYADIGHHFFRNGVYSFNLWRQLLYTTLHEFGHRAERMNGLLYSRSRYKEDYKFYKYIEFLAMRWALMTMAKIDDGRLGQPPGPLTGYFGVMEHRWEDAIYDLTKREGYTSHWSMDLANNVRARKVEGQYTLTGVAETLNASPYYVKKAACALGVDHRVYTDRAGRCFLFFNYGEMLTIAEWLNDQGITSSYRNYSRERRERLWEERRRKLSRYIR